VLTTVVVGNGAAVVVGNGAAVVGAATVVGASVACNAPVAPELPDFRTTAKTMAPTSASTTSTAVASITRLRRHGGGEGGASGGPCHVWSRRAIRIRSGGMAWCTLVVHVLVLHVTRHLLPIQTIQAMVLVSPHANTRDKHWP
jgi:hypothetical protein